MEIFVEVSVMVGKSAIQIHSSDWSVTCSVSKWHNCHFETFPLQFSKQYVQMTVCCAYTNQRNELIAALTSHMPSLTPFEVTWRHLNWSQNTYRSVRKNIIWSLNPFSKDVLQNIDLTPPPTSLSHRSQSSARKPSNPDREEESAEEEMKITWAQTLSQISWCKMLCHYSTLPHLDFQVMSQLGLSTSQSAWLVEAFLHCWHCGSLNCDCCS